MGGRLCIGVGLGLGWATACSPGTFVCQSDAQCVSSGVDGQCLQDGFCGFPDEDCDSGLRYGSGSGDLSGQCAPEQRGTSASTGDGTTTNAGDSSGSSSTLAVDGSGTGDTSTTAAETGPASTTMSTDSSSEADSSSTGAPLDPSLVLWLTFDDADVDGEFPDSSVYEHHGSCNDCPDLDEGIDGTGLRFDGASTYVRVPHTDLLSTPEGFTIAAWIRLDDTPVEQRSILTKTVGDDVFNSWELYFFPSPCDGCLHLSMAVGNGDEGVVSPDPIEIGQWVHVAGTWDGKLLTMWIDGEPVGDQPVAELQMDEHPILVGVDDDNDPDTPDGLDGYFAGLIDDVRVYDRALDQGELADLAADPGG